MTNKQPDGQNAQRYRYRASSSVSRPVVRRDSSYQRTVREELQESHASRARAVAPVTPRRKVTMPHEAIQPLPWAERRERFRQPVVQEPSRGRLVQRTLAQTGLPAPVGQMRARKPLPRQRASSAVPPRSTQIRRSRSFWRRLLGFFAFLIVVGGGIGFALLSPTFHVQKVDIAGTQNTALIATIRHMGIQGQDIFLLNSSLLVARLEALPLIASANVGVSLPSSVTVTVQERTPVLLWQSGQTSFGVGRDGVVIAPQSELTVPAHLPQVIDDRGNLGLRPGARLSAAGIAFAEQTFVQLLGMAGVAPFTLHYVEYLVENKQAEPANQAGHGSYVIVSANGWQAYLGDEQNSSSLASRLQKLQQVLSMARQQGLQLNTIDLRFGSRLVYTVKS